MSGYCKTCGWTACECPPDPDGQLKPISELAIGSVDLTDKEQSIVLAALLSFENRCAPPWKADTKRLYERLIVLWASPRPTMKDPTP